MDDESGTFMHVSPRRILAVKLSSLGDIVHTLPAVAALRKRFSSAHVSWLVKSDGRRFWKGILMSMRCGRLMCPGEIGLD
jgi:hypothetical protein